MTVKKIAKTQSPTKINIVGSSKDKYIQLEGSTQMMCDLLDLQEPNNQISNMNQFIPFTMNVTTEGMNITMMEIPLPEPAQPQNQNGAANNTERHCFNPIPGYCDQNTAPTNNNDTDNEQER